MDTELDAGLGALGRSRIGQRAITICVHFAVDIVDIPAELGAEVGVGQGSWPVCYARLRHTRHHGTGLLSILRLVGNGLLLNDTSLGLFVLLFFRLADNRYRRLVLFLLGLGLWSCGRFARLIRRQHILIGWMIRRQRDSAGDVHLDGAPRAGSAPQV